MDEQLEDGNAFAITNLWKVSTFAPLDERAADSIAFVFEPLSTSLSPNDLMRRNWILISCNRSTR